MKILTAAALALLLSAGVSYAQTNGGTDNGGANSSGDSGTASGSSNATDQKMNDDMSGPMSQFFTDDTMKTMRSESEMNTAYGAMKDEDRKNLKSACLSNKEEKYAGVCKAVNAMK